MVATRLYSEQGMHAEAEFAARRVLDLDAENVVALSTIASRTRLLLGGRAPSRAAPSPIRCRSGCRSATSAAP